MPKVMYIEHDGTKHQVEVPVGRSVMRGAVENNVPGIDADCARATCHVYIDPAWLDAFSGPARASLEASMLGVAAAQPNSRLSCQIDMQDALDGLIVQMPKGQH